jgi:hypothetical protein
MNLDHFSFVCYVFGYKIKMELMLFYVSHWFSGPCKGLKVGEMLCS